MDKVFANRGQTERDLFLGRFSPFHNGHKAIVEMMKNNPVIVLVKGKLTGEDKTKNPFPVELQERMIKKVFPRLEVSISPNGFLPGILGHFRKKNQEITRIFCGEDRIQGYRDAIARANKKMDPEYHYNVEFIKTPRITSATEVRKALKNNDARTFQKLVPKELHAEFENLKIFIKEIKIMDFETYLKEGPKFKLSWFD